MAYYADLAGCDYFDTSPRLTGPLLAVGWLERDHDYTRGEVGRDIYERIATLLKTRWEPFTFMGWHECALCRYDGFASHKNLFVPGRTATYVAPEGIRHYIACHDYLPPAEFCAAVLASPPQGSSDYFKALEALGWAGGLEARQKAIRERDRSWWVLHARGQTLASAVTLFRQMHDRWPETLSEALAAIDGAEGWHYKPDGETYILDIEWLDEQGTPRRLSWWNA